MSSNDVIEILWMVWFGALMIAPLWNMKPERRFYDEGHHDKKP